MGVIQTMTVGIGGQKFHHMKGNHFYEHGPIGANIRAFHAFEGGS